MVLTIPMGTAAFAIAAILYGRMLSFRRTMIAILLAGCGFGFSTLLGSIPTGVTLSSILGLATTGYQGAAYTLINDQLNAGGVVTVSTSIESIGTWTGVAWLHENYSGTTPIIESLMASTVNGRVLHGGITDAEGGALSADFSQLQNSGAAPDGYQGILRKSDPDFTLSIPGMSIPLTRTWTSSRREST